MCCRKNKRQTVDCGSVEHNEAQSHAHTTQAQKTWEKRRIIKVTELSLGFVHFFCSSVFARAHCLVQKMSRQINGRSLFLLGIYRTNADGHIEEDLGQNLQVHDGLEIASHQLAMVGWEFVGLLLGKKLEKDKKCAGGNANVPGYQDHVLGIALLRRQAHQ